MSNPEPIIDQTPAPQIPKEELELKKLALEIRDLERPFWKRPTYILAGLPTMLAVVTLSIGLFNGYFSASLIKLDNQKHDLEAEVKAFQITRDELYSTNDRLKKEKESLIVEKDGLKAKRNELYAENSRIRTEKGLLVAEKELLVGKIEEMQLSYEAQLAILKTKRMELEKSNSSLSQNNDNLIQAITEQEAKTAKMLGDLRKEKEVLQARLPKETPVTCLH